MQTSIVMHLHTTGLVLFVIYITLRKYCGLTCGCARMCVSVSACDAYVNAPFHRIGRNYHMYTLGSQPGTFFSVNNAVL